MKNLIVLFSLCPYFLLGQVENNFENSLSGEWEQYPDNRWGLSYDDPLEGTSSLKHLFDNPESGCDAISYSIGEIRADSAIFWSFLLYYDYKPSGSNKWSVFLLSKRAATFFQEDNQALILGVNQNSTDDSLRLYFQEGGKMQSEFTFPVNWETDIGIQMVRIELTKSNLNLFKLKIKLPEKPFEFSFSVNKKIRMPEFPEYFGLLYCYTSSKDRLLSFDELFIKATIYKDTAGPELKGIDFLSKNKLQWEFNEDIFFDSLSNIFVNENIFADSIHVEGSYLTAIYNKKLENDHSYRYRISGIHDRKGNRSELEGSFLFFYPEYKDIVISEIMADPSPVVYLPNEEYIELYNRTAHPIELSGFILQNGSRTHIFPEVIMKAHDYLLLGKVENSGLKEFPGFIPFLNSSGELKNTGQEIILYSPGEEVIEAINFSDAWYKDDLKKEGGWSLERIDIGNICGNSENWMASNGPDGGTPGSLNSVNGLIEDNESPYPEQLIYMDSLRWKITMNETIIQTVSSGSFSEMTGVKDFNLTPPFYNELLLKMDSGVSLPFYFQLPLLFMDCNLNSIQSGENLILAIPDKPEFLDVLFSEIMFEPDEGAPEFIELYNNSKKVLSMNHFRLEVSGGNPVSTKVFVLGEEQVLFYPGEYKLLTSDKVSIRESYFLPTSCRPVEPLSWSSLPNGGGRITLRTRSGKLIDEMEYSEDLHFPMLNNFTGISLERVYFDKKIGTASNWHSASSLVNFSTPGFANSQQINKSDKTNEFWCELEKFSPDNDGIDDVEVFSYQFDREGFVGQLILFDAVGRIIRNLSKNTLLGTKGNFIWDGRDNRGNICHTGIYLAYFEVYQLSGIRTSFKETVVLINAAR